MIKIQEKEIIYIPVAAIVFETLEGTRVEQVIISDPRALEGMSQPGKKAQRPNRPPTRWGDYELDY